MLLRRVNYYASRGLVKSSLAKPLRGSLRYIATAVTEQIDTNLDSPNANGENPKETTSLSDAELLKRWVALEPELKKLGSKFTELYSPYSQRIHSQKSVNDLTISDLMAAQCHMGHHVGAWNIETYPFVLGKRDGILIINLDETMAYLKAAASFINDIAKKNGIILVVGTGESIRQDVADYSRDAGCYYINEQWFHGILSNSNSTMKASIDQYLERTLIGHKPEFLKSKEDVKIPHITPPDLVIFLNTRNHLKAVNECTVMHIPTVGVIDTDCDPNVVSYPIPANDESARSLRLILGTLMRSAKDGFESFKAIKAREMNFN